MQFFVRHIDNEGAEMQVKPEMKTGVRSNDRLDSPTWSETERNIAVTGEV